MTNYYPEDYGDIGVSAEQDTAAISNAISAAESNGEGVIVLGGVYHMAKTGTADFGMYQDVDYCVLVSGDNIHITGNGTIILDELPSLTTTKFVIVGFATVDGWSGYPGEDGNWISNVGISKVAFDVSAVSMEDRKTVKSSPTGCVAFSYARYFHANDCVTIDGLGEGVINAHFSCKLGSIQRNTIIGASKYGIRLDGGRYVDITNNKFVGNSMGYTSRFELAGINLLSNKDNQINSQQLNISENQFINCRGGAFLGSGESVHFGNNQCYWDTGNGGSKGLQFVTASHVTNGDYSASRSSIVNNRFHQGGNILSQYGQALKIAGDDLGKGGDPITVEDVLIEGNRINDGWETSVELGEQAKNNYVINNVLGGDIVENLTASDNIIEPNY